MLLNLKLSPQIRKTFDKSGIPILSSKDHHYPTEVFMDDMVSVDSVGTKMSLRISGVTSMHCVLKRWLSKACYLAHNIKLNNC